MANKGIDALRASRRQASGAEAAVDNFAVRLKVWGRGFDEFVILSPAAAKLLAQHMLEVADEALRPV